MACVAAGRSQPAAIPDDEGTVSTAELARRSGLSLRQVDHWLRRGVLRTADGDPSPGSGQPRRYAVDEVAIARVLRALRPSTPLDVLRGLARELRAVPSVRWPPVAFLTPEGRLTAAPGGAPVEVAIRVELARLRDAEVEDGDAA